MTAPSGGTVGDFMHRYLEVVAQDASAVAVAGRMREQGIGSVLVESVDPGSGVSRFAGIATETDLVQKVLAKGLNASQTRAAQIMASPLLTITPDQPMLDAGHLMEANRVRHLCVLEGGDIVGLISVRDLVRYFVDAESGPLRDLDNVYRPLSVLMGTTLGTIRSEETLLAAAQSMTGKRMGSLLVIEAGEMVGIVTESDLVRKGLASNLDMGSTHVGSAMNHPLLSIDINRTVRDASGLMAEKKVRHLAVTENHKVVGILSVRDLVKMVSVRDKPRFLRKT